MEIFIGISVFLAALAGIVTSIALLWTKVVKPFFRFCRRIGKVADVVQELPEWCASVDEVLRELQPNHGGTIRDKVHAARTDIAAIRTLVEHHMTDSELHRRGDDESNDRTASDPSR